MDNLKSRTRNTLAKKSPHPQKDEEATEASTEESTLEAEQQIR
jgi:hypothetical protein